MAGPWEKYQQPAAEGPWAKYGGGKPETQSAPQTTEEWERAVLLPMETNKSTGERRWAVPGFLEPLSLPGQVLKGDVPFDPRAGLSGQDPEQLDRAAGAAGFMTPGGPMMNRGMVKPGVRQLQDTTGRPMPKMVANELESAGIGPAQMQTKLGELGPAGVIGDLSPRLQARVGAVATTPGPGQDMVIQAMMARQKGANARIKGAVGDAFGPEPIPSQVRADIDQARQTANAAYQPVLREKALSDNFLYDAKPLAAAIDRELPNFVGDTRAAVKKAMDMLVHPETGELTTDPQIILAVRHELDGVIGAIKDQRGSKTTLKALSDLRKMIDDDLAQQVPGIKWADAKRAEVGAQEEGFQLGRDALKGGDEPIHPVDFDAAVQAAGGPQGTAIGPRAWIPEARKRVEQGVLSRVYQQIGVTANDRVALKAILKGDGSWNRDKMVTIFGEEKAQKLIDLLDAEAVMAQTENLAFGNSKTEMLKSAKDGIEPPKRASGVLENVGNIQFGTAAAKVGDRMLGGIGAKRAAARNEAIARALLSRDGWRAGSLSGPNPGLAPLVNSAVLDALIERGRGGGVMGR